MFHIHIYIYRFSPVWVCRWTMRLSLQMKLFPQSLHTLSFFYIYFVMYVKWWFLEKSFSRHCTFMRFFFCDIWCSFSVTFLEKAFPHRLYWWASLLYEYSSNHRANTSPWRLFHIHCIHDISLFSMISDAYWVGT